MALVNDLDIASFSASLTPIGNSSFNVANSTSSFSSSERSKFLPKMNSACCITSCWCFLFVRFMSSFHLAESLLIKSIIGCVL